MSDKITIRFNKKEQKELEDLIEFLNEKNTWGGHSRVIKKAIRLYRDNLEILRKDFFNRYSHDQRELIKGWIKN